MKVDVQENFIEKRIKLPPLGQRILKTGVAVFLCLLIYYLRGYQGMVSQSCVSAIICMQPYRKDSVRQSLIRVVGTLIGAVWGLLFLQCLQIFPVLAESMLIVYLLMAAGVVLTLYSTVLLKQSNSAGLAAIVFICIVISYPEIEAPFAQTCDRVIDTLIGIGVAYVLDSLRLPRERHDEYIFFVRLQDLVPDRYAHVSPRILVQLNRLYNDGARISLVSEWAPAFLLAQMGTMEINLPVIVMDGAAMYDIPNKKYINVTAISRDTMGYLDDIFRKMQLGYCIYAVQESNMFVYRCGLMNQIEEEDYNLMKRSPYRNYVKGEVAQGDQIAFVRIIDIDERIDVIEAQLQLLISTDRVRMVRRKQPVREGSSGLYFYNPEAGIQKCKNDLVGYYREHGQPEVTPVDIVLKDKYSEREAIHLLGRLRDIYEPVSLKKFFK